MKQNKQAKQIKYLCPKKNPANFLCAEPFCQYIALKCIGSHACDVCRKNHGRCPRQSRIQKIIQIINQKQQTFQIKLSQRQDLIQKLINQLKQIQKQYNKLNIKQWGIDKDISELIFQQKIQNKKGSKIASFINTEIVFPSIQFYYPPQFKKDVQQMKKINDKLRQRMLLLHRSYKILAQCDVELKQVKQSQISKLNMQIIQYFHNKLKDSIQTRLSLKQFIYPAQQEQPSKEQIDNFHKITKIIFIITLKYFELLFKQEKYQEAYKCLLLIIQLSNQNRKQFKLFEYQQMQRQHKLSHKKAYCSFKLKNYQQAFKFYSSVDKNDITVQIIQMLVEMCQHLNKDYEEKLKYNLLLLEVLYEQQKNLASQTSNQKRTKLRQKILHVHMKIAQFYKRLKQNDKLYEINRKINQLLSDQLQSMQEMEFANFMQRELFCISWQDQKQLYEQQSKTISNLFIKIKKTKNINWNAMAIEIQLKIRYMNILVHKFLNSSYAQFSNQAVAISYHHLSKLQAQKSRNSPKQALVLFIKKYLADFLMFKYQTATNSTQKLDLAKNAVKLCEELKLHKFKPYFRRAQASLQLNQQNALRYQYQSNQIYPTHVCYLNSAYIIYKNSINRNDRQNSDLKQCIGYIDKSLQLKPSQQQIYHFRGIVNQNLKNFQQSNKDLHTALKYAQSRQHLDIKKRIAQNNQFLVKQNKNSIAPQQQNRLLSEAHLFYQQCLRANPQNFSHLLSYARVCFLLKQFDIAEKQFIKLQNTDFCNEAYMYLGNIKQQRAKQNDDRNFQLLEQALQDYKKAGESKENLQNLSRIYKQLDRGDYVKQKRDFRSK